MAAEGLILSLKKLWVFFKGIMVGPEWIFSSEQPLTLVNTLHTKQGCEQFCLAEFCLIKSALLTKSGAQAEVVLLY